MFTKIDDTHFKMIGEKKDNLFPSLESRLHILEVKKSFFGTEFIFSPMARYDNTTVAQVGIFKDIYEYTKSFHNEARVKLRKEMKIMNKMNLILKGDPGTGKTHLACTVASELVKKHNGIGIVINDIENIKFDKLVDDVRINDEERLVVIVLDELEKSGRYELVHPDFLAFLDGAKSKENVIILATVNSIENFPDFLIKRPGRFEKVYDFVFNTEEVLTQLTEVLTPKRLQTPTIIKELVARAVVGEIKTIDHLRFTILDYLTALENGKAPQPIVAPKKEIVETISLNAPIEKAPKIDKDIAGVIDSVLSTMAKHSNN